MIPKIDSEIGILIYSTTFEGCGGQIKIKDEDFQVFEVLSQKTLKSITPDGDYPVYILQKRGIDTTHALKKIFTKNQLRLRALGLKDSNATTEQYVFSNRKTNSIEKINERNYSLRKIGFTKKPLSKKNMIGNKFKIIITNPLKEISNFNEFDKILNFFGYQRFGSSRPVTHLIGKALLQNNFELAVNLLLTYTSQYDSKENTDMRKKFSDKDNFKNIIDQIPYQMDLERIVVQKIIQNDNYKNAIQALPLTMRRFFIQAYQSFLFNKTLSMSFNDGEDLTSPKIGDVCYDGYGNLGKYSNQPDQKLSIPLIGYSYYKKTRFDYQISKILDFENIRPKDFFVKEMQEISNEGGFRNSIIKCESVTIDKNTISFTLSRGSYATIVLREIMKPENPIHAGF